jgi:tetratricopeptide (TPR) repeat protein
MVIIFFGVVCLNAPAAASNESPGPDDLSPADIDSLMEVKTVENCRKAIAGYETLLKNDPDNVQALCKIAKAYISIMDIKTSAMIEEKDEYKAMLKEMGKIANDYAQRAYELEPGNKETVAACLVSHGYYSASFGIVKAVFKGAAGRYKRLANQLIDLDETFMGALGYRMLGKLYLVAPWPVGSDKKALKFYKKAVETDGKALHSRYYLGFLYFDDDEYDRAAKEFRLVVESEPCDHEQHYIGAYKESARQFLDKIAKMKQK